MTAPTLWNRRQALTGLLCAPGLATAQTTLQAPPLMPPFTPPPFQRRALQFPRDFGSHPDSRTEWWYMTGWLRDEQGQMLGFQITFFRSRVDTAQSLRSRLAARQLLIAHAAVTDLSTQTFAHEQSMTRWDGQSEGPSERAFASTADTHVRMPGWTLEREPSGRYTTALAQGDLHMRLTAAPTQAVLLQGEAGWSRKGPEPTQASFYYTQPQLAVEGVVTVKGRRQQVSGQAWLDHEWSEALLHPEAVGWDWTGMNLLDGGALTAFRLRRADGSTLWTGGSYRPAAAAQNPSPPMVFGPEALVFTPLREWVSPATQIRYPVDWRIDTPAGDFELRTLMDAQELDSRATTGAIYWEGLSQLYRPGNPEAIGRGYLEMTGYGERIRLG